MEIIGNKLDVHLLQEARAGNLHSIIIMLNHARQNPGGDIDWIGRTIENYLHTYYTLKSKKINGGLEEIGIRYEDLRKLYPNIF